MLEDLKEDFRLLDLDSEARPADDENVDRARDRFLGNFLKVHCFCIVFRLRGLSTANMHRTSPITTTTLPRATLEAQRFQPAI